MNTEKTPKDLPLSAFVLDAGQLMSVDSRVVRRPKHGMLIVRSEIISSYPSTEVNEFETDAIEECRRQYETKDTLCQEQVGAKNSKEVQPSAGYLPLMAVVDSDCSWTFWTKDSLLPVAIRYHLRFIQLASVVSAPEYSDDGLEAFIPANFEEKGILAQLLSIKLELDFASNYSLTGIKRGDSIVAIAPTGTPLAVLKLLGWLLTQVRIHQRDGNPDRQFPQLHGCSFQELAVFLQQIAPVFVLEIDDAVTYLEGYVEYTQDPVWIECTALGLIELLRRISLSEYAVPIDAETLRSLGMITDYCERTLMVAREYYRHCTDCGDTD